MIKRFIVKPFIVITIFFIFLTSLYPFPGTFSNTGERKRIYVSLGGGYAAGDFKGAFVDLGAEARLFGNIYARAVADYYFGTGDSIDYAYGGSIYGVIKFNLSETSQFYLNLGAHYTTRQRPVALYGVTVDVSESAQGYAGGLGLEFQLNNRLILVLGGAVKHLPGADETEEGDLWFKISAGVRYRIF